MLLPTRRAIEFGLIFFVLPLPIVWLRSQGLRLPLIAILWAFAVGCWLTLRWDPTFDRSNLWRVPDARRHLLRIVIRFGLLAPAMYLLLGYLHPEHLFILPRERPGLWAMILCLYPIFSVLPQSIVWRTFILHRYRPLLGDRWLMWLMATLAFGFIHLVFLNVEAIVITTIGGALFVRTQMRSGSMVLAGLEHAMYGCWAFTVGFGRFLYGGAVPPPG